LRILMQRLHQQLQPGLILPQQSRRGRAGKHRLALQLGVDRLHQQQRGRLSDRFQRLPGFQLRVGARPVAAQAQQLHQRSAQVGIRRFRLDIVFDGGDGRGDRLALQHAC
jgi:hypothetical protein